MTTELILTLSVLVLTMFLFVTELFRVDVIALLKMIVLPWHKSRNYMRAGGPLTFLFIAVAVPSIYLLF